MFVKSLSFLSTLFFLASASAGNIPIPTENGWVIYNPKQGRVTVHEYDSHKHGAPPAGISKEEAAKIEIEKQKALAREARVKECVEERIKEQSKYHKRPAYFLEKECRRKIK